MTGSNEVCPNWRLSTWWTTDRPTPIVQTRRMTARAAWEWHILAVKNGAVRVTLEREDADGWSLRASYTWEGAHAHR